jgi:hypothetical protein
MRGLSGKRVWLGALCAATLAIAAGPVSAQAAFNDPLFVFTPVPPPPPPPPTPPPAPVPGPSGYLEGPCGLAVDSAGNFHVSDYYHHVIDEYESGANYLSPSVNGGTGYLGQIGSSDPLDGPCGLAFDSSDAMYVNNFHRSVVKLSPVTVFDTNDPTGVAVLQATNTVYVDDRTYVAVYDSSGTPIAPLKIGLGSLQNGYGVAVSDFPATSGRLYVPDAATDTVKVYDPAVNTDDPIATLNKPAGGFVSLVDSAIAVDNVTGEIYVADHVGSRLTEHPETAIYVFDAAGAYKGRLKYNVVDPVPVGLTVDNSAGSTQGRVYVTSGNTIHASVYAYPPHAASSVGLPATFSLSVNKSGSGGGSVTSSPAGIDCTTGCQAKFDAGGKVPLTATPDQGSYFAGWSGGGCSGSGDTCTVTMSQAASVGADFEELPSTPEASPAPPALSSPAVASTHRRVRPHHKAKHRRHKARHHRR